MIQRIATAAVLSAAVAALFSPSFAQTVIGTAVGGISSSTGGNSVISTLPSPAPQGGTMTASPAGSVTITQSGASASGSQSGTMSIITAPSGATLQRSAPAKAQSNANQAQAPRRAARSADTDVTERPITDCLNDAAAQQQSFDSCKQ